MYDDYDDGGRGYNGDTEHDMWTDYTTDVYEDSDYTGEYTDHDTQDDTSNYAGVNPGVYVRPKSRGQSPQRSQQWREKKILYMESRIERAKEVITTLEKKSANASSAKKIREFEKLILNKRNEISGYQVSLDKLKAEYAKEKSRIRRQIALNIIAFVVTLSLFIIASLI